MKHGLIALFFPLALTACKPNDSSPAGKDTSDASSKSAKAESTAKAEAKATAKADAKPGEGKGDAKAEKTASADSAAPAVETAHPAVHADKSTDLPDYPESAIQKIDDSCTRPYVILATAPESVGESYEWKWAKQALIANPEFHVLRDAPVEQWQVYFAVSKTDASMNNAYVLLARCHDGFTCNHLAAMYKAAVKSSHPQLGCGTLPSSVGEALRDLDLLVGGPQANLPDKADAVSSCARIGACTAVAKPSDTDDVGIDCQKAPSNFNLACAHRFPCSEVMSCLGK